MDGVLIDSEPLWRRAMIQGFQEIGVPFTEADCRVTTGMRFKEVVEYWFQHHAVSRVTPEYFNIQVIHHMADLIRAEGRAMEGVYDSLDFLAGRSYKIGLATSSSNLLLEAILEKLNIRPFFHQVLSAEFLQYGKPHPEVFINCALNMGIPPRACLVIEDSLNGVIAAKAAQMQVVAIPDAEVRENPKFQVADYHLKSLKELPSIFR